MDGAGSEGLVAVCPGKVETFSPPDRWHGCVPLSMTADDTGGIWVGTEGAGLYHLSKNNEWKQYAASSGFSNQFVWCVSKDDHDRLWAGTWGVASSRSKAIILSFLPAWKMLTPPCPPFCKRGMVSLGSAPPAA